VNTLRRVLVAVFGACLLGLPGCLPSGEDLQAKLQDEDPAVRLEAIHRAGQIKDRATVPYLIDRLTDSQRDVRFFAAIALRRITGRNMGWKHYAPRAERDKAVKRWRRWLETEGKDAPRTQPARGARQEAEETNE